MEREREREREERERELGCTWHSGESILERSAPLHHSPSIPQCWSNNRGAVSSYLPSLISLLRTQGFTNHCWHNGFSAACHYHSHSVRFQWSICRFSLWVQPRFSPAPLDSTSSLCLSCMRIQANAGEAQTRAMWTPACYCALTKLLLINRP